MTYKEELENKIVQDKLHIDSIMQPEDGAMYMQHRALPYMTDLNEQMTLYMKEPDIEQETCCMIYMFLADNFTYIPYLPLAVECYTKALYCAINAEDETVIGEIPELVYKIAKYRNIIARDIFYAKNDCKITSTDDRGTVYDACDDIDVGGKLKLSEVKQLIKAAADTVSRSLIASAAEHTQEYLKVICEMNDTLMENLENEKDKDGFCHAYWAAKKVYLHSKGIKWESPSKLNPDIK